MRRNKRGRLTLVVLAGVLSITLVMRLIGRTPHAPTTPGQAQRTMLDNGRSKAP